MLDHIGFPVSDFARSKAFYERALAPLGYRIVKAYRPRPGTVLVRLRLNARGWRPGSYRLRVVAFDPWRRRSGLTLRFRYP